MPDHHPARSARARGLLPGDSHGKYGVGTVPASADPIVRFRVIAVLLALAAVALGGTPAAAAPRAVTVAGGDTLNNAGSRCTLGFNVTGRGILAGRCGPVGTRWSAGTTSVGVVTGSSGLSMVVDGSGNCTSGGTTYSQPITPLLSQTGRAIF